LLKTSVFDEILPGAPRPACLAAKPDARNASTRPAKARGHCQKQLRDATADSEDLLALLRFYASSFRQRALRLAVMAVLRE